MESDFRKEEFIMEFYENKKGMVIFFGYLAVMCFLLWCFMMAV